jgi:transcriptional regulator with XRE-family HTH domain
MNAAATVRDARRRAGLTQTELAEKTGTSQATISAYESGAKQPSVDTLSRLLAATGLRLAVEPGSVRDPSRAELERAGRHLAQVIALAEALPARRAPTLRYPRLAA